MRYEVLDGEILDHKTGLVWMKQVKAKLTFGEAQVYAGQVALETGRAWRVPTLQELWNLIDIRMVTPASGFPDMSSDWYWSSSPYAGNTYYAWYINFNSGVVFNTERWHTGAVRLVRNP
jgi:hypothetical protein